MEKLLPQEVKSNQLETAMSLLYFLSVIIEQGKGLCFDDIKDGFTVILDEIFDIVKAIQETENQSR